MTARSQAPRLLPPKRTAAPGIDIVTSSKRWKAQPRASAAIRRAIAVAAKTASTSGGELAIVLTDDSEMRVLNRRWRGKDQPTNVLSFPAASPRRGRGVPRLLGDIVIAYETTAREAAAERKQFLHHLSHLAVHGYLHLLGYDHERDEEAAAMEGLEAKVLARLGLPNPYMMGDAKP